jgi:hypothetical protein
VPALTGQCPDPAWGAWTLTRMLPHGMVAKHRFGMLARWVSPEARQGDLSQGSFTAPPEASNSRANKSFALAGPACIMVRKLIASPCQRFDRVSLEYRPTECARISRRREALVLRFPGLSGQVSWCH